MSLHLSSVLKGTMRPTSNVLCSIAICAILIGCINAHRGDDQTGRGRERQCRTVAEFAVANNFTILVAALNATNLVDTFNRTDLMVTVFAPTDAAFEEYFESMNLTADEVLQDTEELSDILKLHVLPQAIRLETWQVKTFANGQTLKIRPVVEGNNTAAIRTPGLRACWQSMVYVIDSVLIPDMDGSSSDDESNPDNGEDDGGRSQNGRPGSDDPFDQNPQNPQNPQKPSSSDPWSDLINSIFDTINSATGDDSSDSSDGTSGDSADSNSGSNESTTDEDNDGVRAASDGP